MKASFSKILGVLLLCAIVGWGVSKAISQRNEQREQISQTQELQKLEKSVAEMATAHNAVTDWKKELGDPISLDPIYTAHLQRALVRSDSRPLLLYASVEDVKQQRDGHYLVILNSQIGIRATIRLDLECESDRAQAILSRRSSEIERYYAVIADITSIRKVDDERPSHDDGLEPSTGSSVSPLFLADGRVVDLLFVGAYGMGLAFAE